MGGLEPWARWVATDKDGLVYQYETKPPPGEDAWGWRRVGNFTKAPAHYAITDRPWTETLRRVVREKS
jgi:hypothetical protein